MKLLFKNQKTIGEFILKVQDLPEYSSRDELECDLIEITLILEGTAKYSIGNSLYDAFRGDLFVIQGGIKHSFSNTKNLHIIRILFDRPLIEINNEMSYLPGYPMLFSLTTPLNQEKAIPHIHLEENKVIQIRSTIEEIQRELHQQNPGFRLITHSMLLAIIGKLSRWYYSERQSKTGQIARVANAIAHMEQHFDEPLSVDKLAKAANMSVRNFHRVFQEETGVSPHKYLIKLRVAQVAQLLKQSKHSVTEIAFECGFRDSSHMTQLFKNQFNLTPSEFRKVHNSP